MASPRKSRAKSIGHYILMKTIGEGTFGKVKLGTHILTGERVAVKVLEKERIVDIADVERVAREIHILKLIRQCRHIIQLYEIIETPRQLYLIMEYASGGELFDYIVQHGRAQEPEACRFLHQILAGVERVHSMRVVHRDLKPENLLLTDRHDIKIVDFGLSNTYQEGQLLQTACGSPCYAAPEMIAGQKYVPSMVDVWSCGVILFALVCGYLPFEDQNHAELYKKILSAEYEMPNFVSREVADLIAGMLTTDPTQRMTLDDIRQHPWYRQIPEASLHDREEDASLDEEILEQLDSYGFPRDYAVKCLLGNKHNHVTTTYYLIREKRLRAQTEGKLKGDLAIAELDATAAEEVGAEEPGAARGPSHWRHAAAAAEVAAVATPSRAARGEGSSPDGGYPMQAGRSRSSCPSSEPAAAEEARSRATPAAGPPSARQQQRPPHSHRGHPGEARSASPPAAASGCGAATPRTRRPCSGQPPRVGATPRGAGPPLSARGRGDACGAGSAQPRRWPASAGPTRRPPPAWGPSYSAGPDGLVSAASAEDVEGPAPGAASWDASPRRCPDPPLSARSRPRGNATGSRERPAGAPPAAWGGHSARGRAPLSARAWSDEGAQDAGGSAMQVSCSSSRPPRQIMQEVLRALAVNGVQYRQASRFAVRCHSQDVRLQAEVFQMDRGGGYTVRFSRVSGDVWHYKEVCARLLAEMNL